MSNSQPLLLKMASLCYTTVCLMKAVSPKRCSIEIIIFASETVSGSLFYKLYSSHPSPTHLFGNRCAKYSFFSHALPRALFKRSTLTDNCAATFESPVKMPKGFCSLLSVWKALRLLKTQKQRWRDCKETRLFMHGSTLSQCWRDKKIPRGLRISQQQGDQMRTLLNDEESFSIKTSSI